MVTVNIVCLASCPESQHARTLDPVCVLFVWCFVTHDLSLSHTDVPSLSPQHLPPLLNTLACISTLRIAGRYSNVLLTDGVSMADDTHRSRLLHDDHAQHGFGRKYVTATLCVIPRPHPHRCFLRVSYCPMNDYLTLLPITSRAFPLPPSAAFLPPPSFIPFLFRVVSARTGVCMVWSCA